MINLITRKKIKLCAGLPARLAPVRRISNGVNKKIGKYKGNLLTTVIKIAS